MTVLLEYICLTVELSVFFISLGKNDKAAQLFRTELSLRDTSNTSVKMLCLVFCTFVVLQEQNVVLIKWSQNINY